MAELSSEQIVNGLSARIHGLKNRGIGICTEFYSPLGEISCARCKYSAEVHQLRDAVVLIERQQQEIASLRAQIPAWQPMQNLSEMTAVGDRLLLAWRSGYVTCGYLAPKRMAWVTPNGEYPFSDVNAPAYWQSLPSPPASPSDREEPR